MDETRRETIRALIQYGGRNYSCAVVYLTRVKKKLKITDYTKNNIGDARIIKNYEINHKWFESSKGLVVNLEDKILNFLELNNRDLIMKDSDKIGLLIILFIKSSKFPYLAYSDKVKKL